MPSGWPSWAKFESAIARGIFFLAFAVLGGALALVVLRNPGLFTTGQQTTAHHHTLDSPYSSARFRVGQPQGQTNTALGRILPQQLGPLYRGAGYEWLSVTDLNTLTPPKYYGAPTLVTLQGADLGYSFGHFLAYGIDTLEQTSTPQGALDWVHANAGAVFVARPMQPPAMDYQTIASLNGLDGIQVLDARLLKDDPIHADATALWDKLLTDHHVVWGIVGDDSFDSRGSDNFTGKTSVDVQVDELTSVLIQDALRRGAFVDSAGLHVQSVSTSSDTISVVTGDADTIKFIGSEGKVRKTVSGARGDYKVDWSEGYIRVLATRADGGQAWTQPIVVNP